MTSVAGYIPRWFTRLQTVTHPSTNRARRWLTSLMRPTTLPTEPNRHMAYRNSIKIKIRVALCTCRSRVMGNCCRQLLRLQCIIYVYTPCSKKVVHQHISMIQTILNGFSKFLHCHTLWKIWDKTIIKDFTTPKPCRCTTLWNINFEKLLELKHGNRKLSAHELKKMWSW